MPDNVSPSGNFPDRRSGKEWERLAEQAGTILTEFEQVVA
jgi:hypothetical protein